MAAKRQRVSNPIVEKDGHTSTSPGGSDPGHSSSDMAIRRITPETQSSNSTYIRPRTRQRVYKQPPALNLPDINEDATERKRVLNVLAQRRYRERRRQGRAATRNSSESQDDAGPSDSITTAAAGSDGTTSGVSQGGEILATTAATTTTDSFANLDACLDLDIDQWPAGSLDLSDTGSLTAADAAAALTAMDGPLSNFLVDNLQLDQQTTFDTTTGSGSTSLSASPPSIDPLMLLDTSSSGSSAGEFSADSYLLPVAELTLLRAFLRIATRLGCDKTVWDLAAQSPFCSPGGSAGTSVGVAPHLLPRTWQPTAAQLLVPHHPLLDFLPWPSARDRIIGVFSLPESARPPGAEGPLALVQFAYDLEDAAEGMRIWGGDPYDPESWEVGQLLFERWWFVFDRSIVEQSNRLRSLRGAATLRLRGAAQSPSEGVEEL